MASWNVGQGEETPEDFESLLKEEIDVEDDVEAEFLDFKEDSEEEELMDIKFETDYENDGSPSMVLSMYTEEGEEIPLTQTSSPPRDPLSTAIAASSPSTIQGCDVVVKIPDLEAGPAFDDDDITEEHVFHLPDEHQLFQQVEDGTSERPQLPKRRRGRECPRSRGQGRRRQEASGPQWVKGDRLIEVYISDDDVSEELREMLMRVVSAREAARVRAPAKAKRQRKEEGPALEEEWIDADYGEDETLFADGESAASFKWSSMDDYKSKREQFLPQQTGSVVASENAYGAFRQYWDDGILSHIVTETNRYAAGLSSSSAAFARDWYDTNIHEILVLFSFWMMLGIIRMPSTKSCFTLNPILQTNIFRKMFTRSRYENLCRVLHFYDNSNRPTDSNNRLICFGPILDHLNSRFMKAYIPSQNICIDESLTLWKGNLSFSQYIRTKAARLGVKTFELCESSTGYLCSFFLYLGAGTTYDSAFPSTLLKSTSSVLKLIHPFLDKGYTLFMDNWFNSPLLARFLKTRKTDCVGTLRANCRNVPPLISLCNLKEGQIVARHSGDVVVLAYQDKKRKITTISTYHGNSQALMESKPHRPSQYKPQVILDYNKSMGGVDRKDQMLEPYLLERKRCAKWNMKVFKRLLNCSILNSRILLQSSTATPKQHLVFRLELVDQILQHHHQHVPKPTPTRLVSSSLSQGCSGLTQEKHWPQQINAFLNSGRRLRRRCVWCSQHNSERRTTYVCSECDVPLCLEPCFKLYHTKS